jgi:AcrR family transcriptional regulator
MTTATRATTSRDRRASILRAALEAFGDRGYAATTIEDVRRRSGASVGSIYHHFGSKEELAGALYVEGLRDYQEGFLAALRAHPGARAGVRAMVEHHLDWVAANRELARYLLGGREAEVRLASEARLREQNRAFFAEVNAWLEGHVERGRLRRLPPDLFYSVLIGPAQEFARHWLAGRTSSTLETAKRTLAGAAWSSLKGERR